MKAIFPQQKSSTLSHRIFQYVEDAIMTGAIAPGERIHADALARKSKVSHIPVREALKRLEVVGLIVQEPHKGARVIELSHGDIRHILEIRRALEGLGRRLATAHIDEQKQRRLQSLVAEMRQATVSKDYLKLHNADYRFQQIIWKTSANPYLERIMSNLLSSYMGLLASKGYYIRRKQLNYVPEVHQSILDAIVSGDGQQAQEAMISVHNRAATLILKK